MADRPHLYQDSDFGDLVDPAGNVVGQAPKSWQGTDLLQSGFKVKASRSKGSSDSDSDDSSSS